jgi:holo-[acyl-carrier protein] synthase
MIVGIGVDLVELERVERIDRRYGEAFVRRFCLPQEPQRRHGSARIQHLGGLFAAKEAVLKALGTGWGQGIGLRDVEVLRDEHGAPSVRLHRLAAERADRLGVDIVHLSISHERGHAVAFALLERRQAGGGASGAIR